jgi:pimeloyl-ACP methyl ester carboxylesterase
MADFPFSGEDNSAVHYSGPTLFIRGTKSKFVPDSSIPTIKKFFPRAEIADVEAGHWLISENPEGFKSGMLLFYFSSPFLSLIFIRFCLAFYVHVIGVVDHITR